MPRKNSSIRPKLAVCSSRGSQPVEWRAERDAHEFALRLSISVKAVYVKLAFASSFPSSVFENALLPRFARTGDESSAVGEEPLWMLRPQTLSQSRSCRHNEGCQNAG